MAKSSKVVHSSNQLEGAWAAAGFAIVLIIVGLPVWWYTTTVYRAALPYSTIEKLSHASIHQVAHVQIVGENAASLKSTLENKLRDSENLVKFSISSRGLDDEESKILIQGKKNGLEYLGSHLGSLCPMDLYTIFLLPNTFEDNFTGQISITHNRLMFIKETIDIELLSKTLRAMALDPLVEEKLQSSSLLDKIPKGRNRQLMRQVPTEPGYDITITLMIPQPHLLKTESRLNDQIEKYLSPLLNQFQQILDLRVRSQVLYMTSLKVSPRWSDSYKHFSLPQQQLPLTINAIEAKLGSFVSTRPSLHFVVYIPRDDHTPLKIHNQNGLPIESNSFLVPRWGGVIIQNPKNSTTKKEPLPRYFEVDGESIMQIIVTHLHKLLPIPQLEKDSRIQEVSKLPNFVLSDWQLDGLARARVVMYLNSIKITLQSLCDLVGEISNMVVSDEVAGWVWAAVEDWRKCLRSSSNGTVGNATVYCTSAFKYSDAAFFHPSMLALLYFPDNQKYAIYIPLFLPVSIPVILSLKMIFTMIRSSQQTKKKLD